MVAGQARYNRKANMEQFLYYQMLPNEHRYYKPVATRHPHSRVADVLAKVGHAASRAAASLFQSL